MRLYIVALYFDYGGLKHEWEPDPTAVEACVASHWVSNYSNQSFFGEVAPQPKPWDNPDWVLQGIRELKAWLENRIRCLRLPHVSRRTFIIHQPCWPSLRWRSVT